MIASRWQAEATGSVLHNALERKVTVFSLLDRQWSNQIDVDDIQSLCRIQWSWNSFVQHQQWPNECSKVLEMPATKKVLESNSEWHWFMWIFEEETYSIWVFLVLVNLTYSFKIVWKNLHCRSQTTKWWTGQRTCSRQRHLWRLIFPCLSSICTSVQCSKSS